MQARLAEEPEEVKALALPADADFDRDGIISTDELDAYAKQVLPQISPVIFPSTWRHARPAATRPRPAMRRRRDTAPILPGESAADQALALQGSEAALPADPAPTTPPARP